MLKIGTKVKNIRLVEGDHNIDCKIDGFGPMKLKSEFVKRTDLPRHCPVAPRLPGLSNPATDNIVPISNYT